MLVVGGAGYVGSHMCLRLHEAGHRITVLDNLSSGHRQLARWGEFVHGALEDRPLVEMLLKSRAIDVVMHFAAMSEVGQSVADPYMYYRSNVVATLGLLEAMRAQGVTRLIFSSTAAVYGDPQSARIAEDHPRRPVNPYGKTKLAIEYILEDASTGYGLHAVSLRYFNAAGADPLARIGEHHDPETHLIPRLLRKAAGEAIDVRIFGSDYPTHDGSCIRDYVHVCDLADAHLQAFHFSQRAPGFHAFNLGSGQGYSVREVIRAVERVTGCRMAVPCAGRRVGDPAALVADSDRAAAELGWMPRYQDIDRIVEDAWRWQQRGVSAQALPMAALLA
ncbi:MAG TPA: UDP-glucose 4-epimerase GalE [Solimonas sp.]|nr:UDP-glucose 4-epimerase GalE [Solimonas sp.]